jgi:hypothetical protein
VQERDTSEVVAEGRKKRKHEGKGRNGKERISIYCLNMLH